MANERYALIFSCEDQLGITAAVSVSLEACGANITEAHQYNDEETGQFFSRIEFAFVGDVRIDELTNKLQSVAERFEMEWEVRNLSLRKKSLILVSRFDHCLADILYRWRIGELAMDIVGIVANYPRETYQHQSFDGLEFHYLPITPETKREQEGQIWDLVKKHSVDLVVLARYMQILSTELSARLEGRCINIHHSFLPGFKGAKPYHQARARGVKLIGATAHYVTQNLDEGPIIEQDVERVSHHDTADALVRKGRDIERRVLSRAIAWHLQGRVITSGPKTIVFSD
jgi:formyltetrahydrofolate deformylase